MKQSESPKERINVTYKPATGDVSEDVEIPFKLVVLGDFNPNEEKSLIEDKKAIKIDKNNFNEVLKAQNIKLEFDVANKISEEEGDSLDVKLNVGHIADFSPEKIVDNVPELKKLMELRQALVSLKGPLGNVPAFRKAIEDAVGDEEQRKKLLNELNLVTESK
ncbi:type VI secretion system contractile sheath small subunit [Aliarcobacter skirrowii]|uniref:Type VI secretion system contractile sheath small subunit n=1 Tax=Aliarcobacter skirrowii TaxID=28200 RepID=A0AAW9DCZ6_9BACT|nr:type VI secretion system contractile sheath small subunit [Aliarcobacter skirrowii]MDX4028668.1 type VI secretion system contractile sheath small subunit [Aliarcobacter skirrowii]MDX4070027.1 type VI secretion system contractile sheath small subunit [Aliarcobacter skirrowii]